MFVFVSLHVCLYVRVFVCLCVCSCLCVQYPPRNVASATGEEEIPLAVEEALHHHSLERIVLAIKKPSQPEDFCQKSLVRENLVMQKKQGLPVQC